MSHFRPEHRRHSGRVMAPEQSLERYFNVAVPKVCWKRLGIPWNYLQCETVVLKEGDIASVVTHEAAMQSDSAGIEATSLSNIGMVDGNVKTVVGVVHVVSLGSLEQE